jgi:thymidylate kinase
LISFSGIDSSGKSTQIDLLYKYCLQNNIKVKKVWGKARGTPGVLFIKNLVRKDKNMNFEEQLEYREQIYKSSGKKRLLLFASILDLCWYFGLYYRILNLFNKVLICDRYIWDTYIEIKTEFPDIDVDKWFIWKFAKLISPKPRVSFMFVIPADVSISRDIQKQELAVDSLELKVKKIELYLSLMNNKNWTNVMDGMQPIEEIHKEVLGVLRLEN